MPVDFEVGMEASLHQHPGATEFHGLADLFVNRVEIENVAFFGCGAFQGAVEGAEGAVFGAEIRVVDVAVDNVGDYAFWMETATEKEQRPAITLNVYLPIAKAILQRSAKRSAPLIQRPPLRPPGRPRRTTARTSAHWHQN